MGWNTVDDDHRQLRLGLAGTSSAPSGALPPELAEALADLLDSFGDREATTSFEADWRAAGMAAILRLATGDASLLGGSDLSGPPLDGPPAEVDELRTSMVEGIAAMVGQGHAEPNPILTSLALYGGPFREPAIERLAAHGAPIDADPPARAVAAHRVTTIPGDEEELVIELGYPGDPLMAGGDADRPAGPRVGLAVLLDTFAGRRPIDAVVCDDVDGFLDEAITGSEQAPLAPTALGTLVTPIPVADALSVLAFAFWVFDHTMGAVDGLPEDSDLLMIRPLLDHLLAAHPHPAYESPEVAPAARREAVDTFTRWARDERPGVDAGALELADLLIDFAADQADDPLRWSATVAINFLQMACRQVIVPPEELAALPDLVRLMVRWSHDRNGWPADITKDTLAAIDQVQPLFDAELEAQGQLGPVEPPVGGAHPEPVDDSRIPEGLRGRVAAMVEEATDRSVELFDLEFATLARRLIADAARRHNSPLARGKTSIWASGAVYAVAQLNEIPGGWSPLARPAAEITAALDGAPNTVANKARTLRQLLDADHFPPEPRYQHSTSAGATGDLLTGMLRLMDGMIPDGADIGLDSVTRRGDGPAPGLRLVEPLTTTEAGSTDPASVGADCFVLRVALADIRPEIWRRVRVPVDATFGQLHELLQFVFDWYDTHLHLFEVDHEVVGPTGDDLASVDGDNLDEDELRLCDAVAPGSEFVYRYDFGDNWEHQVVVEGTEDLGASTDIVTGEPMGPFALLAGKRAGPPEDCGGWPGYTELLAAMRNKRHPRRAELIEWLPVGYDPDNFDVYTINQALHRLRWR